MKQSSLRSTSLSSRSNANETGKSGKQLAAPVTQLAAAPDKKKKPGQAKMENAQLAAPDKKKKPGQARMENAQLAAPDKKKKPAQGKMPEHVQQKMESTMNADFSDVNIHVGSKASSVGALAYAQGNDIHFAQGKFNPNTSDGQSLLGHELAHVVQQRQGRVKATTSVNGLPVNDDRSLEKEADALGAKAASAKI
jgi:hypothetical protein